MRVAAESLAIDALSNEWKETLARHRWGKTLQKLVPFGLAWMASEGLACMDIREHAELWDPEGQVRVELGRLHCCWVFHLFEQKPALKKQCLIPQFRQIFAKELFVFERGPAWESRTDPWRSSKPPEPPALEVVAEQTAGRKKNGKDMVKKLPI